MTDAPSNFSETPKLRWPLDLQHIEHNGQRYTVFRDPLEIAVEPLVVLSVVLPIVSRFDGTLTISQIAQHGAVYGLTEQFVSDVAELFSQAQLLETPATRARWEEIKAEYRAATLRPAVFAGSGYAAQAPELKRELAGYLQLAAEQNFKVPADRQLAALISPHIDYRRGHRAYAAAYQALKQAPRPDVIFLIGTAHQPGQTIFHLTNKDFQTPLGNIKAAAEVVNRLAALYGHERSFQDEILHRREHSLELQLPFLANCYGAEAAPPVVPILVGSFHEAVSSGRKPEEQAEIGDFISALVEVLRDLRLSGKRVLFLGGVDFAHMGRNFGDQQTQSDPQRLAEIERRDRELLDGVLAADAARLFAHIAEDNDRRRICGFSSMYTMFSALKLAGFHMTGHPLDYRQAVDPATDCVVTFAAAAWTTAI